MTLLCQLKALGITVNLLKSNIGLLPYTIVRLHHLEACRHGHLGLVYGDRGAR